MLIDYSSDYIWMEKISLALLYPPKDPEIRQELFRVFLNSVQLEISSFCNRSCSFCSNTRVDRHSVNVFMSDNLFMSIIEQLAAIRFSGRLCFHRYNEPLAYKEKLLEKITLARKLLPDAVLYTNTNGDYLNATTFLELQEAGLNEINVQVYIDKLSSPDSDELITAFTKLISKSNIRNYTWDVPIGGCYARAVADCSGMLVSFNYAHPSTMSDRAGLAPKQKHVRTAPCKRILFDLYVDYNGYAVPCCSMRSDAPEHQKYILGNVSEVSLIDLYFSESLSVWRKRLLFFADQAHPEPCTHCTIGDQTDTPEVRRQLEEACCVSIRDIKQLQKMRTKDAPFLSELKSKSLLALARLFN